jgi:hypothetical protein
MTKPVPVSFRKQSREERRVARLGIEQLELLEAEPDHSGEEAMRAELARRRGPLIRDAFWREVERKREQAERDATES